MLKCAIYYWEIFPRPDIFKDRIEHFIKQPKGGNLNSQDLRALTMLVYIVSLLGEHAELDRIKEQHQGNYIPSFSMLETNSHQVLVASSQVYRL